MEENPLTPEEQKIFNELRKKSVLPYELEDKIVNALRSKKLLTNRSKRSVPISWFLRAAAAVILFYAGYFSNSYLPKGSEMDYTYVLLLHEDENFKAGDSPSRFLEYANWMKSVEASNTLIAGEKLSDELTFIGNEPHHSLSDRVTGYMVVNSYSKESAREIALNSPHIKYGGHIELRQIVHE